MLAHYIRVRNEGAVMSESASREVLHTNISRPSVLFVCVHNAGRSQMAAGFLAHLADGAIEVRSAGSAPAGMVNPAAVEAMAEVGIDISEQSPKILTADAVEASDVVITMGCGDACPVFPGVSYRDWALPDPAGKGIDAVRPIRDEINTRVEALIGELVPIDRRTSS
jgi:arsenate reductase (thioredoxin)